MAALGGRRNTVQRSASCGSNTLLVGAEHHVLAQIVEHPAELSARGVPARSVIYATFTSAASGKLMPLSCFGKVELERLPSRAMSTLYEAALWVSAQLVPFGGLVVQGFV